MSPAVLVDLVMPVASVDVDSAVLNTIETWMDAYLSRVEDQRSYDRNFLARPRSYDSVIAETQFLDHSLPAVLAATSRTQGSPVITADDGYTVDWLVAVSCVVRGQNAGHAKMLGSVFEAVVRKILVDCPTLDGSAQGVRWIGGAEVRPLPDQSRDGGRWLAEGASQYLVRMDDVVKSARPPITLPPPGSGGDPTPTPEPPPDPYQQLPVPATTVDTSAITAEPIPGGNPDA